MAIGELKIVPNGVILDGYIEYAPYLDITEYPKLVAKIGDTVLPPIGDYSTIGDLKLRIGKTITCDGTYFCWDYVSSNLYKFPEVKEHFMQYAEDLDLGNPNRNIWLIALEQDCLPDISHRMLSTFGASRELSQMYSGQFFVTKPPHLLAYPMVEHNENVLYPAGINSKKPAVEVDTSFPSCDKAIEGLESQYVLLAKRIEDIKFKKYPFMYSNLSKEDLPFGVEVPNPDEEAYVDPALSVQVLINTRTGFSSVPEGFKLVIAISDAQDAATVSDINAITREIQNLKSRVTTLEDKPDQTLVINYQQASAQEIIEFYEKNPHAALIVNNNGEQHTTIFFLKKSDNVCMIRHVGTISGKWYIFEHTITDSRWTSKVYPISAGDELQISEFTEEELNGLWDEVFQL